MELGNSSLSTIDPTPSLGQGRHRLVSCLVALLAALLLECTLPAVSAQSTTPPAATNATDPATGLPLRNVPFRQISGVFPHLTVYGIYSQEGGHFKEGHNECGIGAIVPWANKLWMVNYAPHMPRGSEHKLFSIDNDLNLTIHPESVGGTPAGRMIHRESKQLLIGHHLIDSSGVVRSISPAQMPIRVTAIARHLTDPKNFVYYVDMEGSIWEANVHTLDVKQLFKKPVPGWHAKGGYTSQNRLIVSNNGEHAAGTYDDLLVGGPASNQDEAGVLAEWDGANWKIIERRQFTDITGPDSIHGSSNNKQIAWAIGWDKRSLRLKVLQDGDWSTFLLPKAAFCNDARHGWYTEWPRIRPITDGKWMMDMHGMFFDFSPNFSSSTPAGIRPIGSHLRYIPDFCDWNGTLVLATDETSIQENPLAGQPQTNLWFGSYAELKKWGPASGYGGPWINTAIKANSASDPFLIAGFEHRIIHLAVDAPVMIDSKRLRTSDQYPIEKLPETLRNLPSVSIPRGDWTKPAPGFSFQVSKPVTVWLCVDGRGSPQLDPAWKKSELTVQWGDKPFEDVVYSRSYSPGQIDIPANTTEHKPGSFGSPHLAFVEGATTDDIRPLNTATVALPPKTENPIQGPSHVNFTLEIDRLGTKNWEVLETIPVRQNGYVAYVITEGLDANWLRIRSDADCTATAYLHCWNSSEHDGNRSENQELFRGLARSSESNPLRARLYPNKHNRNLSVVKADGSRVELAKDSFQFRSVDADPKLTKLLSVQPELEIDDASVVLRHSGHVLRLPKGPGAWDPTARWHREVESERQLANIHGSFYEVPLVINGQPPAFDKMRPVCSHDRQIFDYCSWNGLLILSGVSGSAKSSNHLMIDQTTGVGLWVGGIDDLWRLGKPIGDGGPWLKSPARASIPSDAYLMTGYDKKQLRLESDTDSTIHVEINFDHQSGWHRWRGFSLKANTPLTYDFPPSFSAHWIRFVSENDATVTAQLRYR